MSDTRLTKEALYVPSIVFEQGTLSCNIDGNLTWNGEELGTGSGAGSGSIDTSGNISFDGDNSFTGQNTFTQYVTFHEGLISNGDIVLNGSKLLLANEAAIEVYPDANLPLPEGGHHHLEYYALYKEMTDTLLHNAIYHLNEVGSINFALEDELDDLFSCEVVFTSGATPTTVTSDERIKWVGDDVNAGVFTPIANVRYSCSLQYDGVFVRGMTFGIPTV